MQRTAAHLSLAALLIALAGTPAPAQHFVPPPPVEPAAGQTLGEPVALLPRGITSFGAATLDGWLYVYGGYFGQPHNYIAEHQSREFYRINLFDLSDIQPLPNEARIQSVALVAHRGSLIRVGGMVVADETGPGGNLRSIPDCARFDPGAGVWTDLPPMPDGRSSHDALIIGDTLYVAGGWKLDPAADEPRWHTDLWTLDLASPNAEWNSIPAPFTRRAIALAALDNALIIIGGMSDPSPSGRVDVLDTATGEWTRGPDLPGNGFGAAAIATGGQIIASGAEGRLYAWKPGQAEWQPVGQLTFPRFFHRFATTPDGDTLALGGITRGARPRHIERIDLTPDPSPARIVAHWTLPFPGSAKNRQGIFLRGDSLYLFGGNNSVGQHDFEPDNFLAQGWRFDLPSLDFHPVADFPAHRQTIQTAIAPDSATGFAIGGFGHDGAAARAHADAFAYDFRDDEWTPSPLTLPAPRTQFGLAEHKGKLWIFGGLDYDPSRPEDDRFRHLTDILSADLNAPSPAFTDAGVALPRPRRAFGGALLDGRYYLVGGMREDFQLVEPCDVFDLATGTWSEIPAPSRPRISPELVALDGRLFLIGGTSPKPGGDGSEPNPSVEMYDPATGAWSTILDTLPITPRHIRAFAYRGHVLLLSTHDPDRSLAHAVLIRPEPSSTPSTPTTPSRAAAAPTN